MKRVILGVLFANAVRLLANAPDSLVGLIYYETGVYAGPTPRRGFEEFAATFRADGTYQQLYWRSSPGAGAPAILGQPRDGTYSYRKLDAVTAEFTLDGIQTGRLRFDSDKHRTGQFIDPNRSSSDVSGVVRRSFRLAELNQGATLLNCSNRAFIRTARSAFTGFVIGGSAQDRDPWRTLLIRVIGPSLSDFGIAEPLRDPRLTVSRGGGTNDNWASENEESIRRTSAAVGAFPLRQGTRDGALIATLAPGSYVIEAASSDESDSGEVLIEVYLLP